MKRIKNAYIVSVKPVRSYEQKRVANVSNDNVQGSPQKTEDWAKLVSLIAINSDREAFKCLYNYFAPRVKSFMLRAGLTEGAAEEIAQETLLIVWRKSAQYAPSKAAVSTWIYTIARNKKIDKFRKDSRPLPDANDPSFLGEAEITPEQTTFHSVNSAKVRDALSLLPDDQREVLFLAFIEESSHRDISKALNIPLGTVKSRIRLGIEKLRVLLNEHRGDYS